VEVQVLSSALLRAKSACLQLNDDVKGNGAVDDRLSDSDSKSSKALRHRTSAHRTTKQLGTEVGHVVYSKTLTNEAAR
jgi:hypothetical protein